MDTAKRAEVLARRRRHILFALLISYAAWCGTFILELGPPMPLRIPHLVVITMTVFGLLWVGCCVWLTLRFRQVRTDPQAVAVLSDERTVHNRWRAQGASMWVLLTCLVLGLVLTGYVEVSARLVLLVLIWVVGVSQLGFYLWFDRNE